MCVTRNLEVGNSRLGSADQQGHQWLTKGSYHLSALSPSLWHMWQPYLSTCQAIYLQQSHSLLTESQAGREEMEANGLLLMEVHFIRRKSFPEVPWPLTRIGLHAHPLTNEREISYHIWTLANHDLSSPSEPLQPKHRWESTWHKEKLRRQQLPDLISSPDRSSHL